MIYNSGPPPGSRNLFVVHCRPLHPPPSPTQTYMHYNRKICNIFCPHPPAVLILLLWPSRPRRRRLSFVPQSSRQQLSSPCKADTRERERLGQCTEKLSQITLQKFIRSPPQQRRRFAHQHYCGVSCPWRSTGTAVMVGSPRPSKRSSQFIGRASPSGP